MPPSCALLGGFAIGAWVALLWQHYGNAWQSPPHAARMPHTYTTHAGEDSPRGVASDKIDAPAACAVPFRPYCGGVVTRTRNVSEYMLCTRCVPSYSLSVLELIFRTHHLSFTLSSRAISTPVMLSVIFQSCKFQSPQNNLAL